MKTVEQYNKELAPLNHRIFRFHSETATSFCLAELDPEAGFLEKLMKTNIKEEVCSFVEYKRVAKEADNIIASFGNGGK